MPPNATEFQVTLPLVSIPEPLRLRPCQIQEFSQDFISMSFSRYWNLAVIFVVMSACLYLSLLHQYFMMETISDPESLPLYRMITPAGNQTYGLILNTSTSRLLASSIQNKVRKKIPTSSPAFKPTTCQIPTHRIVYIKTHKTGSTTLVSILERYGYSRNLSFATKTNGHIICDVKLFEASMIFHIPYRTRQDFDMLVNHARYNRPEMDKVVPNAKYISIIRNPVTQLESVFGYFEVGYHLKIPGSNPFRTFMSDPRKYYQRKASSWRKIRNGQLFDLGFDHEYDENEDKIKEKIEQLSKEIDFMLINEYFDESLIILRKLFCWDFKDILYLSHGIRSKTHRYRVSEDLVEDVLDWSAGDAMLYKHFNQSFWKKVNDYGPDFQKDLEYFQNLKQKTTEECVNAGKKNRNDKRVEKFVLKRDSSNLCKDMLRDDSDFTKLIRTGMVNRALLNAGKSVIIINDNHHRDIRHPMRPNRTTGRNKVALSIPGRRITNLTAHPNLTNRLKKNR